MIHRLTDDDAKLFAAAAGVTLAGEAAHNAAWATAAPLAAADPHSRALPFEAEPSQFVAAQRRSKR